MITGDNALTACHVARQLRFCRTSTTLILTNSSSSNSSSSSSSWVWQSVDESVQLPLRGPDSLAKTQWRDFLTSYDMCLTGQLS
jgi:cation-transporting ATPase 13A1